MNPTLKKALWVSSLLVLPLPLLLRPRTGRMRIVGSDFTETLDPVALPVNTLGSWPILARNYRRYLARVEQFYQENPGFPTLRQLYEEGVRYRMPLLSLAGLSTTQDYFMPDVVRSRKEGVCADFTAMRIAELKRDTPHLNPFPVFVLPVMDPRPIIHALVGLHNDKLEDPSVDMGMFDFLGRVARQSREEIDSEKRSYLSRLAEANSEDPLYQSWYWRANMPISSRLFIEVEEERKKMTPEQLKEARRKKSTWEKLEDAQRFYEWLEQRNLHRPPGWSTRRDEVAGSPIPLPPSALSFFRPLGPAILQAPRSPCSASG